MNLVDGYPHIFLRTALVTSYISLRLSQLDMPSDGVDLSQIDVHVPDNPDKAAFWVKLNNPLKVEDTVINSIYIEPMKYASFAPL